MKATLMLMNTTAAGPLLLVLLLPWDATTARPVLLWLLLLRHTNTARYHMVIPSLSSDSHGPPHDNVLQLGVHLSQILLSLRKVSYQ